MARVVNWADKAIRTTSPEETASFVQSRSGRLFAGPAGERLIPKLALGPISLGDVGVLDV